MDNVFIRPAMDGKRVPGKELKSTKNGLRYQSPLNTQHRVHDILFSNVQASLLPTLSAPNWLSSSTSIWRILSWSVSRRRPRMFSSIEKQPISNLMRLETESENTDMATKRNSRPSKRNEDVAQTSIDNSKAFAEKIWLRAGTRPENENVDVDVPLPHELGFNGVPFRF